MRRAAAALLMCVLCASAAHAQTATPPPKLDLAVEAGGSIGLGSAKHDGARGWIDASPNFHGFSYSLRANRVALGVQFETAHTDTLYHADPANGGRFLIGPRNVAYMTESITTRAVLFTARLSFNKQPRTLNPYMSVAFGNAKLRDRVTGDTLGTTISSVVGRRAMAVGAGLETRGYAIPHLNGLLARGFVDALYWTRNASGESARLGVFYTSPYGPTNNYYQARDHRIDGLDTPPGKMTYMTVSLGVRMQYKL